MFCCHRRRPFDGAAPRKSSAIRSASRSQPGPVRMCLP